MIIYIGFSSHTHKFISRILCKHFKHCAPVIVSQDKCEIYQFTKPGQITVIPIQQRDLKILEQYGWKFIKYNVNKLNTSNIHALTCVQFTKTFCNIHKIYIQTPDALLKDINNQ